MEPGTSRSPALKLFLAYFAIWIVLYGSQLISLDLGALRGFLAFALGALALQRHKHKSFLFACLMLLTVPWETHLGDICNGFLGQLTAYAAAPLVNATGLSVQVIQLHVPTLATENLQLHVTPLCAGMGPLLSFSTLGVALGLLFLDDPFQQKWLAIITPLAGLLGNILRVAISTHAANIWLDRHPWAWDVAHDLVGYLCFVAIYAALWFFLKNVRNKESASIKPSP